MVLLFGTNAIVSNSLPRKILAIEKRELNLSAMLSPNKTKVKLGDEINLSATLKNDGNLPFRMLKEPRIQHLETFYTSWICELRRDSVPYDGWKSWRHSAYPIVPKRRDTKVIRNGNQVAAEFDLKHWYPIDAPGTYEVRAVFVQRPIPEIGIIEVPPVYSNWITVIVE